MCSAMQLAAVCLCTGRTTSASGTSGHMSTHSVRTAGISNDARETQVDNNSAVGQESEVVRLSTDVNSSPTAEIAGGTKSGSIVDVLYSEQAAAQHTVTSNHLAASDMGNANNKDKKTAKSEGNTVGVSEEVSNGLKEMPVTETDQTPECMSESKFAAPSSNTVDVSELKLTEVDNKAMDDDKRTSDVIPGIPDAQNDVTTSGIPREADTKLESVTMPQGVDKDDELPSNKPTTENDVSERTIDNISSSVRPETETVGRSTDDSVSSSSRTEIAGSSESGKIVDVLSSALDDEQHSVTSNHLAGLDMGNANKVTKSDGNTVGVSEEVSNGLKEMPVEETDQTPEFSDSDSVPPSVNVTELRLTEVDNKTIDDDRFTSDVTLSGDPGIPDVHNDVTTSGIPRESSRDVVDSMDVGLDNVNEMCVSVTQDGSQLKASSSEICLETQVTLNSEEDTADSHHDCSQDSANLDHSTPQHHDVSASTDIK